MTRLDELNLLVEEIGDNYGWYPNIEFGDESKIEEYKVLYITEFMEVFDQNLITESINPLDRVKNV